MASLVAENWVCINGDDDSNGVEVNKFHSDFLMSLLEEPHGDQEYSDEQINEVIQSLEAEINEQNHLAMELPELLARDVDGQNCLASTDIVWADMEVVPSSPSEDMNWSIEHREYELDGTVGFDYKGIWDYYPNYSLIHSEEHGFSSFFHETHNTVTYY